MVALHDKPLLLPASRRCMLNLAFKIDGILANNKQYDEGILTEVEYLIDSNTPEDASFKPVYVVFALIKEELEL